MFLEFGSVLLLKAVVDPGALGTQAPLTPKKEAQAPNFYKIKALAWHF